ncbi:MAG TPA: ferrochelatase [Planctomycetota bacterium]|nr:ferrochelatase [Planctomycetota bacterium]
MSAPPAVVPTSAARGVLLVNLGSPAEPTPAAVRAFLDEFLGDPRVVDLNPALWWAVRKLLVLPRRAGPVSELYASIWTPEGSPLIANGRRLARALGPALGDGWRVALGMRYGEPSLAAALAELASAGCREVLAVPLFPQASGTTTGTIEVALRELARRPGGPRLRLMPAYPDHPAFVRALGVCLREELDRGPVDHTLFSLHGLPERYVRAGDPYRDHCERTARALARELGLADGAWTLSYQSKFGPGAWLAPSSESVVPALAARAPRVLVAMPGFAADCLETLEEVGVRLADSFLAAGGRELRVAPCLNDHPAWVAALAEMVEAAWRSPESGDLGGVTA